MTRYKTSAPGCLHSQPRRPLCAAVAVLFVFVTCSTAEPAWPAPVEGDDAVELPPPTNTASVTAAQAEPAAARTVAGLRIPPDLLAAAVPARAAAAASRTVPPPPPSQGVRKAPLIIGIVGTAVMIVGIAFADDDWWGTAGTTTAVIGGATAVVGFYFAFKR